MRDAHILANQKPVVDHRIYTDRGPNRGFTASVVGVMVNVRQ